ncbi:AzlC family ABC transporter permease [Paracoccus marinus]|uniref:AzlC family ABC transporter permease n=1 Tax=Paracoccus marinus TaxID=288426 RepID=UPI001040B127|nr:branched-chain amino acid transporter AzlC [Paracoccus marinus]
MSAPTAPLSRPSPANPPAQHNAPTLRGADPETPRQAFRRGMIQALPFLLVLIPFGLLFGVIAQTAGFDVSQTMGFSVLVLAGASQFTAVELLSHDAPVLLVIASALAINLRMAMYSASLVPIIGAARPWERALAAYALTDQSFAMAVQNAERRPQATLAQRLAHFWGAAVVICPPWVVATYVGATVGNVIPADWPLDFAVPITFLSMVAPMLRTWAHLAAATVAIGVALVLAGMPNGTGLLIAGPAGMCAGAAVEAWTEGRKRSA